MGRDEKFHLYLLTGQSNMAGRGPIEEGEREPHPRVLAFDRECKWVPAVDPIHFDKSIAGVGLGTSFGDAMADRDPDVRIGLIPCAAGGSPISSWVPGGYWEQTDSHPYDEALRRTRAALEDGVLKGILWHQGESDSNEENAGLYEERLVALVKALRRELEAPDVPFVAATLADFFLPNRPLGARINEAIKRLPESVEKTAWVDSDGLGHIGDEVHFDTPSLRELGRRFAESIVEMQRG